MINPPAFPRSCYTNENFHNAEQDGMTLRDYFAGMVLQGIAGDIGLPSFMDGSKMMRLDPFDMAAKISYDLADAMLAAREKP